MRMILLALLLLPSIAFAGTPPAVHCVPSQDEAIPGVDLKEVRRMWLSWTNAERKAAGVKPYTESTQLDRSAVLWSTSSRDKGIMDHKRPGQTAYYDYAIITKWFAALGLTFRNVSRMTYSESIGYGPFSCSQKDCTQIFIAALRSTFDFYLKEKNQASKPHYSAIVNPQFAIQGMGVTIDPTIKRYYVTTHYATAITSRPVPVCP